MVVSPLAKCLINSSALPANPQNMELYFFVNLYRVRLFTDSNMSDTDNIVPFENTTSTILINLLCVLLFCPFYFD